MLLILNQKLYQDVEIIMVYFHVDITFTERLSSEREREREKERERETDRDRETEREGGTYLLHIEFTLDIEYSLMDANKEKLTFADLYRR